MKQTHKAGSSGAALTLVLRGSGAQMRHSVARGEHKKGMTWEVIGIPKL